MTEMACLVLAAGQSQRFGSAKQLALVNDKPILRHTLEKLHPIFKDRLFCVLGAYVDETQPIAKEFSHPLEFKEWTQGMGASLAYGVTTLLQHAPETKSLMVALSDQIGLEQSDYQKLIDAFDGNTKVSASYSNIKGVPAIFAAKDFKILQGLKGDTGARKILLDAQEVPLPAAAFDVDTPQDLIDYARC